MILSGSWAGGEILAFVYRKWGNLMRYTTQIGLFLNISDIQWESGCDKEMTRTIKKWWTIRHLHNTFRQNFPFNNVVCLSNADLTFLTKWCRGPLDMIGEKKNTTISCHVSVVILLHSIKPHWETYRETSNFFVSRCKCNQVEDHIPLFRPNQKMRFRK